MELICEGRRRNSTAIFGGWRALLIAQLSPTLIDSVCEWNRALLSIINSTLNFTFRQRLNRELISIEAWHDTVVVQQDIMSFIIELAACCALFRILNFCRSSDFLMSSYELNSLNENSKHFVAHSQVHSMLRNHMFDSIQWLELSDITLIRFVIW